MGTNPQTEQALLPPHEPQANRFGESLSYGLVRILVRLYVCSEVYSSVRGGKIGRTRDEPLCKLLGFALYSGRMRAASLR